MKGALHTEHGWVCCDAKCLTEVVTSCMPNGTAVPSAPLSPIAQPTSDTPVGVAVKSRHDESAPGRGQTPAGELHTLCNRPTGVRPRPVNYTLSQLQRLALVGAPPFSAARQNSTHFFVSFTSSEPSGI
jgi:hypothetical protein